MGSDNSPSTGKVAAIVSAIRRTVTLQPALVTCWISTKIIAPSARLRKKQNAARYAK